MSEAEMFFSITKHLIECKTPIEGCQTCHKVFGEKRPIGLIVAAFEETVRKYRQKRGQDTSTPKEVE